MPWGIAVDGTGSVYVSDRNNHRIRKITSEGVVSTLAGSGTAGHNDGAAAAAMFNSPIGIAVDGAGNVYAADSNNHCIRKITSDGIVTTLAGNGTAGYAEGTGTAATFRSPRGVAVDGAGNVYAADVGNHCIRKITSVGVVSTLAGNGTAGYTDGPGAAARFDAPQGVAVDGAGNVYVADTKNNRIRKITSAGVVTTLAGSTYGYADGPGTAAKLSSPTDVAVDGSGNVYSVDLYTRRIRKITSTGQVTTMGGTEPLSNYTYSIAVDSSGTVYIADYNGSQIRKLSK